MGKTARVPGTFAATPPPRPLIDWSLRAREIRAHIIGVGALAVDVYRLGDCTVIVSREPMHGEYRWHVSISHPHRYPTWDEIKTACFTIDTLEGVTLAQVLTPGDGSEWVDMHPNCFHLYEIHDDVVAR